MSIGDWKDLAAAVESFATVLSFVVGGLWVYRRYIRQQENYPNIEFSADLNFIGKQGSWWIVEIVALIENKGRVQHRMKDFKFDVNAIYPEDEIEVSAQWDNQVNFSHPVARGSLLPEKSEFFFIDPGIKAKYSYVARIPAAAQFLILHCWFRYPDRRRLGHSAEKTLRVPDK